VCPPVSQCVSSDALLPCSFIEQFTSLPAELPTHEHNACSRCSVSGAFGRRLIHGDVFGLLPLLGLLGILLCRLEGVGFLDQTSNGL
jgi:hypothetical protein